MPSFPSTQSSPSTGRRLRRLLVAGVATVGLAVPVGAVPAGSVAPDIAPASYTQSIDRCTVSLTPSTFGPTDTVAVSTTFSPVPGFYQVGADGVGAGSASVAMEAFAASSTTDFSVATLAATWGLAPGTHTIDFYGVTENGAPIGEALCSTAYTLTGTTPSPGFDGPSDLPPGTVGQQYATGGFTYTPTAAAQLAGPTSDAAAGDDPPYRVRRCALVGASLADGGRGRGGDGSSGGNGGRGGLFLGAAPDGRSTAIVDSGLVFTPTDEAELGVAGSCGRLWGTPTRAGTYAVTVRVEYSCPAPAAPAASTAGVEDQTFAVYATFTLEIAPAPSFTG